ncbi:RNA-binding (RRM/RBD/RNP motifs) family protein [Zea mays]|uniref:RNA-binding (RRM/RBD/RNP motifs) family protein n=1 Tax=Zea mays TaxID=4577 RepID=A0A1D6QQX9_MAIZE|nr:RNA-binding (RRM/RBD/RNP motifs) family protein [Zea mays]
MREDLENEVSQIKDKISAKGQHIADLQKKAQVISVMVFKGFCCPHLPQIRGRTGCCTESLFRTTISCYRPVQTFSSTPRLQR